MPKYDFQFSAIIQTLEHDNFLAEALFFPEITRWRGNADAAQDDLRANLTRIVEEDLEPLERSRRHFTTAPEVATLTIELAPAERSLIWRNPVSLQFSYLHWQYDEKTWLAYVPSLGIEIIATSADALAQQLPQQIHAHLLRTKAATALGKLVWLQRCQSLAVETLTFKAELRTPKQLAMQAAQQHEDEGKKSVLNEVATDLTLLPLPEAYELNEIVTQLAEAFTGMTTKSVLLVGKSGVGKTAAVQELVRQRHQHNLSRTVFRATSGARLIAGMSGYGKWQERCEKLWREAARQKAILHVGNLIEMMEVGKSEYTSQGIMEFLRPYIARGVLLVIAECTPEQLPIIERNDPHLLEAFHRIEVAEPGLERGRAILRQVANAARQQQQAAITDDALARLDALHRRYATYSSYPGRPLRFLKNLLKDSETSLTASEMTAAFSRETGLPLFLLEESVRMDLATTHDWFATRVIGQTEAVDLVVDLLATVKAGLVRPRKPIASLLFIGPTGTGKTEMAKSLAEFLFQDRHRLVRFDMSEYSDARALQRLIGGVGGTEGLLTSKVREQPFAVVLLDEIEKAHPQFFDLLLQVLGEGRLTDAGGRVADFCNAVVIMTSNLGAQSYQRGIQGFTEAVPTDESQQRQRASQHFMKEVRAFVRPELFNRIDRVVPFAPLSEDTVQRIAERELEKLKQRDGLKYRGVNVTLAAEVAPYLARKGYEARYGARPLKRTMERELLAPLAEQLNQFSASEALTTTVTLAHNKLHIGTQRQADPENKRAWAAAEQTHLTSLTRQAKALRVAAQRLLRGHAMMDWRNQVYRLTLLAKRLKLQEHKWQSPEDLEALAYLPKLQRMVLAADDFLTRSTALEDEALLMVYGRRPPAPQVIGSAIATRKQEWQQLLLPLYSLRYEKPDRVTLLLVSESTPHLFQLARVYFQYATELDAKVKLHSLGQRQSGKAREMVLRKIDLPEKYLETEDAEAVCLSFDLTAPFVFTRLAQEHGSQVFKSAKQEIHCLVNINSSPLTQPLPTVTAREFINSRGQDLTVRRIFAADQYIIEDKFLDKRFPWNGGAINAQLAAAIDESLHKTLQSLLEE